MTVTPEREGKIPICLLKHSGQMPWLKLEPVWAWM
jgi:hypothetical protein